MKKILLFTLMLMLSIASAVPLRSSAEVIPTDYVILIVERPEYSRADIYYSEWGSSDNVQTLAASGFPTIYKIYSEEGEIFYEKTFSIVQLTPSDYGNEAFEILTSTLAADVWVSIGLDEYYDVTGLTRICNKAYTIDDVSVSPTPTPSPTATPSPTPTNTPTPAPTATNTPIPTDIPVSDKVLEETYVLSVWMDIVMSFMSIPIRVLSFEFTFFELFVYAIIATVVVGVIFKIFN